MVFDKTFQNNQTPSLTLDVFCAMSGLSKSTHLDKTKNQKTTQEKTWNGFVNKVLIFIFMDFRDNIYYGKQRLIV
jgi:hypothetical protein